MSSENYQLSEKESELFTRIREGNFEDVKRLLTEEKVNVDCLDQQGITPLQESAYRGNYELCKLLLDCGADVNAHYHVSGYSTLTFAGLSGKASVVSLLLEHGAQTTSLNSVNRTAAQMAAFVGNHQIVSIINNFIPKEAIDYFTVKHGLEKEPKLQPLLIVPLHKMVLMTNIHPVRLAMYLQNNMLILKNSKNVIRVLDLLCEKQFKEENNALLSLKLHHLSFVLTACENFLTDLKSKTKENESAPNKGVLEVLIKHWIKGENAEGFPVNLEKFLRQSVREYPFHDCPLLQQLVHTLAPVQIGEEPSAISILSQAIYGQRGIDDTISCVTCGEPKASKKCSACKYVQYCDKICQKLHWFTHKNFCTKLAEKFKEEQKEERKIDEINQNLNNSNLNDQAELNDTQITEEANSIK